MMARNTGIEENHLGIKVKGDLGEFQFVEEKSESEDEDKDTVVKSSRALSTLSTSPHNLVKPTAHVFGSVAVSNSENVQFGNNTYFNGPVTIKQVVHNSEHDNPGFEHTEEEGKCAFPNTETKLQNETTIKKLELRLWIKLTISAVCIIVVACFCAILSIVISNQAQTNGSSVFNVEEKEASTKVEGVFHIKLDTRSLVITLLVVLLTFLWFYMKLTYETYYKTIDMKAISGTVSSHAHNNDKQFYNCEADPLLIAPDHLRIVSRTDWLASPVEKPLDPLKLPAPWVIITHTATENCSTQSECVLRVRLIQSFHVESRKWYDIGYNFLVAGDGSAYYGRGWDYQGAHTLGYNKYSIGIAFIGTFNQNPPPKKQVEAAQKLIRRGVGLNKIAKDYKLFGHRQLASTLSPGDKLFDIIKEWPHFVNTSDISSLVPSY